MELTGRVVLVTGAARRVGAAIVRELAAAGARIALHYHTSSREAATIARELRERGVELETFQADLADPARIDGLFAAIDARFGGIDALVSNASIFERTPFLSTTLEQWNRSLQLNLTAPFWCARLAAERMRARGGGAIIHLADVAGERAWPNYAPYSCAKAALIMLTEVLALELAPEIRVNAVAPGMVAPPEGMAEETRARLLAKIPLGREGSPADVAKAVRFLLEQDYITGEVIRVDGGRAVRS